MSDQKCDGMMFMKWNPGLEHLLIRRSTPSD